MHPSRVSDEHGNALKLFAKELIAAVAATKGARTHTVREQSGIQMVCELGLPTVL